MKRSMLLLAIVSLLFGSLFPSAAPAGAVELPDSPEVVIFIPGLLAVELRKNEEVTASEGVSKVHLVAHSMGGLAKKYILDQKTDTKVRKLVTLGTPFYGAPFARKIMQSGYQMNGVNLVGSGTIQSIPILPPITARRPSRSKA
jgi:hypothetical protein